MAQGRFGAFLFLPLSTSLSQTDVCNIALSKIGSQPIQSITDLTNKSAIFCNTNWQLSYLEVSRATRWNCLLDTAILAALPQIPLPEAGTPSPTVNWEPNTAYPANIYLAYGGGIYLTQYAYTSTASFVNDLTTGALVQADYPDYNFWTNFPNGSQYPSGWAFKYQLPDDFVLMAVLNDNNTGWGYYGGESGQGALYQIMGDHLFTNAQQAVIKYVKNQPDTTRFDALFVAALAFNLASKIATPLRQDSGQMEAELIKAYMQKVSEAKTKNAGEGQPRRFTLQATSRFGAARKWSTNG